MGIFKKRPRRRANRFKPRRKKTVKKKVAARSGGLFARNMAMDLGTANTLIYLKGTGIVLDEPTVVAYHAETREVLAVGREAKSYLGRTPASIEAVRPLRNGAICDYDITQSMIREFFLKVQRIGRLFKPKVVVCVPAGITQVEEKAVVEAAAQAGVGKLFLLEEPLAAAIGVGIDIDANRGQMIVNIGGGITDVAILTLSSVAYSESLKIGGDTVTEALIHFLLERHQMKVGEISAERCKIAAGSACPVSGLTDFMLSGKDAVSGTPRMITLSPEEIREAIRQPVAEIVAAVRRALEQSLPDLVTDIAESGINLVGGGALLHGLDRLIEQETGITCKTPPNPQNTVVMGTGKAVDNLKTFKKVFL